MNKFIFNGLLNKKIGRFVEIMVKVTSWFSTLIRQHIALIYDSDSRFVEFFFLLLEFNLKTISLFE